MPATEDVQRQVAVAVVVAMEVAAFLAAVKRVVCGVEIEHDAHRRLAVRLHEQIDEQLLDGAWIVAELVVDRAGSCLRAPTD